MNVRVMAYEANLQRVKKIHVVILQGRLAADFVHTKVHEKSGKLKFYFVKQYEVLL